MNKKATLWKLILNTIFSLCLIATSIMCWFFVDKPWEIFLFLTLWSSFSIMIYIVCCTIYDYTEYFHKQTQTITKMNYFIRNHYVRICIPYSIAVVLLFWTLVIMGDEFFNFKTGITALRSCYLHGFICIFGCIDLFISEHLYFHYYGWDILTITIVYCCYLSVIGSVKFVVGVNAYPFMQLANVRQCIGAALVIYMIILGAYALFMFVTFMLYGDNKGIRNKKEGANVNNGHNNSESMNKFKSEEINIMKLNKKNGSVKRNSNSNVDKQIGNDIHIEKTQK